MLPIPQTSSARPRLLHSCGPARCTQAWAKSFAVRDRAGQISTATLRQPTLPGKLPTAISAIAANFPRTRGMTDWGNYEGECNIISFGERVRHGNYRWYNQALFESPTADQGIFHASRIPRRRAPFSGFSFFTTCQRPPFVPA